MQIKDQRFEDQRFEVTHKEYRYLGPGLELHRCEVICRSNRRNLIVNGARFVDCEVHIKSKLTGFSWCGGYFEHCTFHGKMSGCDFGNQPDHGGERGGVSRCDFSDATLDGCQFIDCDLEGTTLPAWPGYTLLDPIGNAEAILAVDWPGNLIYSAQAATQAPKGTVAIAYHAEIEAKEAGVPLDALRTALEALKAKATGAVAF